MTFCAVPGGRMQLRRSMGRGFLRPRDRVTWGVPRMPAFYRGDDCPRLFLWLRSCLSYNNAMNLTPGGVRELRGGITADAARGLPALRGPGLTRKDGAEMARNMLVVIGLVLLLVGGGLYVMHPAISENDAIQRAARTTRGADGQRIYTMTSGEIRSAMQHRQTMNADREGKRQIGLALAVPGGILALLGLATGIAASKPPQVQQG